MIIDAALFLWSKCKLQFQRVVSSSMEGCKFVLYDKDANKVKTGEIKNLKIKILRHNHTDIPPGSQIHQPVFWA